MKFDIIGIEINLHRLLSSFKRECTSGVKSIEDPSWFADGQMPEGYDTRKLNNPWLFTGVLISDIYSKKPNLFE